MSDRVRFPLPGMRGTIIRDGEYACIDWYDHSGNSRSAREPRQEWIKRLREAADMLEREPA